MLKNAIIIDNKYLFFNLLRKIAIAFQSYRTKIIDEIQEAVISENYRPMKMVITTSSGKGYSPFYSVY